MDKEAGNQDAVYIEQELEDMDAGDILLLDDGELTFDIWKSLQLLLAVKWFRAVFSPVRKG